MGVALLCTFKQINYSSAGCFNSKRALVNFLHSCVNFHIYHNLLTILNSLWRLSATQNNNNNFNSMFSKGRLLGETGGHGSIQFLLPRPPVKNIIDISNTVITGIYTFKTSIINFFANKCSSTWHSHPFYCIRKTSMIKNTENVFLFLC